jgi:CRP/FNR family transcriptional regulator, cyclic AMP receptor protein
MTADDELVTRSLAMLGDGGLDDAEMERRVGSFQAALRRLRNNPAEAARIDALVTDAERGLMDQDAAMHAGLSAVAGTGAGLAQVKQGAYVTPGRPMGKAAPAPGFWQYLGNAERVALSAMGRETAFARGMTLCLEGDPSTHVFILLAGWVKVISSTAKGGEIVLALRRAGDLIGDEAAALDGYRTATVRALMPVEALTIAAARFTAFLDAYPSATGAYRRVMAERQHELAVNMRGRMETSGAQRLARLLLDLAARCGDSTEHGVRLAVPLSQADLASWAGMSRATLVRALHQWR